MQIFIFIFFSKTFLLTFILTCLLFFMELAQVKLHMHCLFFSCWYSDDYLRLKSVFMSLFTWCLYYNLFVVNSCSFTFIIATFWFVCLSTLKFYALSWNWSNSLKISHQLIGYLSLPNLIFFLTFYFLTRWVIRLNLQVFAIFIFVIFIVCFLLFSLYYYFNPFLVIPVTISSF